MHAGLPGTPCSASAGWPRRPAAETQSPSSHLHARLANQLLQAVGHVTPIAAAKAQHQGGVVGKALAAAPVRRHAVCLGAAAAGPRAVAAAVHHPRFLLRLRLAPPLIVFVQLWRGYRSRRAQRWVWEGKRGEQRADRWPQGLRLHHPPPHACLQCAALLPTVDPTSAHRCSIPARTLRRQERRSPSKSDSNWKRPHCWQKRIVWPSTTRQGSSKW